MLQTSLMLPNTADFTNAAKSCSRPNLSKWIWALCWQCPKQVGYINPDTEQLAASSNEWPMTGIAVAEATAGVAAAVIVCDGVGVGVRGWAAEGLRQQLLYARPPSHSAGPPTHRRSTAALISLCSSSTPEPLPPATAGPPTVLIVPTFGLCCCMFDCIVNAELLIITHDMYMDQVSSTIVATMNAARLDRSLHCDDPL